MFLYKRGILSLGTIRKNGISGCKLPEKLTTKRADFIEYLLTILAVDISTVTWKDNKVVIFTSTYVGIKLFRCINTLNANTLEIRQKRKDDD